MNPASPEPLTPPELEEAIKHVTAYDDCQMGMLEWTKVWRLVVAARQYVWMLQRAEDLHKLNAKLASIVLDDNEGDLDFIKFKIRAALKQEGASETEEQVRSEASEPSSSPDPIREEMQVGKRTNYRGGKSVNIEDWPRKS